MFADRVPASETRRAVEERRTLRKHASYAEADPDALKISLFRADDGVACGWFIGPLAFVDGRVTLPFLQKSERTRASVAIVRAVEMASSIGCPVCVIDPEDLWEKVWAA